MQQTTIEPISSPSDSFRTLRTVSAAHTPPRPSALKKFGFPALLLAFVALLAVLSSSIRLMWYDETATYEPAVLSSASQTLAFFTSGTDTPSPLPSLVLHAAVRLWGDGDMRNRIPFILFFLGSCVFVYAFAAKRYPPLYSAIVLLLPAALGTFIYASEMRAYAFLLFFTSLMMYCWQRCANQDSRTAALIGLWIAFAGAVLSHVFAIFLLVPFTAAELSRAVLKRRLDKAVILILLTAPLALLLVLPGMLHAHAYYAKTFWSRPSLQGALDAYGSHFIGNSSRVIAFLSIFVALMVTRLRRATMMPPQQAKGFTLPEWVLVIVLAFLPIYAFVGAIPLGVFVTRYTIPFVLGLELAFMGFLAWSSRFSKLVAASILVFVFGVAVVKQHNAIAYAAHGLRPQRAQQYRDQQWIAYACAANLPVLATSPHDFMVWQHYSPSCLKDHLFYGEDLVRSHRAEDEINMDLFKKRIPLNVINFDSFVRSNPKFLIADAKPDSEWLVPYLHSADGASKFKIVSEASFTGIETEPYRDHSTNDITVYTIVRN